MAEQIISFEKGMIKDIAKTLQPSNSYYDANNIRLTTDIGQSNGALINVKGNTLVKKIPDTFQVYKITLGTTYGNVILTINGFNTAPITTSISLSGETIYNAISLLTGFSSVFNAAWANNYVTVWGLTSNPTISTSNVNLVSTLIVPALSNLEPIGYAVLRDFKVLFTTNDSSITGGYGQIWKMVTDPVLLATTPTVSTTYTLLYNNDIKFTKQHPFPRNGGTVSRYENSLINRVYWTDWFNPLRSFNVANPQGFAIDPTILDVVSAIDKSIPVLKQIHDTGGSVPISQYFISYQLGTVGGSTTSFTPISNGVKILDSLSTANFRDQFGNIGATTKSITWTISNIDTDYDRIKIAIIRCDDVNSSVPTSIDIVFDEPIPADGKLDFTFTNNEIKTSLSLDEFLALSSSFNKCKAIATKDNRLFAANLSNNTFDITFDARAFRWKNAIGPITSRVYMADGITFTDIVTNYSNITSDTTHDNINSDYFTGARDYRFKKDGLTIGGEGVNISYTFEAFSDTSTMYSDVKTVTAGILGSIAPFYGQNFRFTNPQASDYTLNGITYKNNNFYTPIVSPYIESLFKGYQHSETYRFGIVFYNKQGDTSFVKWIGDIECPRVHDTNGNNVPVDFSHTGYNSSTGFAYTKILHPTFTVNLATGLSTADKSKISGFSIVRAIRGTNDKTILYTGVIHPIEFDGAGTNYLPNISNDATESLYGNLGNAEWTITNAASNNRVLCTMTSVDNLLSGFTAFQAGDKLDLVSVLTPPVPATWAGQQVTAGATGFSFEKIYTSAPVITGSMPTVNNGVTINISNTHYINKADLGTPTAANPFDNTTFKAAAINRHSVGDKTVLFELGSLLDYSAQTTPLNRANAGKFYAYYRRPNTNQYGGRSNTQKSLSRYTACQHFQSITDPNSIGIYTISLFGGDTYSAVMETQRYLKNWNSVGGAAGANSMFAYICYFPSECQLNPEWRYGSTINRYGLPDNGTGNDLGEAFSLNTILYNSIDNPIQKYYPKPSLFTSTQEWDNRVAYSQIKINGEVSDSWSIFKPNDYWDVEGNYGPINNIDVLRDQLLFWQDKSFGLLEVNPRALIQDITGTELQLGVGNVIQRHDYIGIEGGAKHQFGMCKSPFSYYWWDAIKNTIWNYTPGKGLEPLSYTKKMTSWFGNTLTGSILTNDNPVYSDPTNKIYRRGVSCTFDQQFYDAIFTFFDVNTVNNVIVPTEYTLSYNEQIEGFQSFLDVHPSIWINDDTNIFTRDPNNVSTLYAHNLGNYGSYYGFTYNSTLSTICNSNPSITKVWDNLQWHSEVKLNGVNQALSTLNEVRCYTDNQNSDYTLLTPLVNVKRKERSWNVAIPRSATVYNNLSPDIFDVTNIQVAQLYKDRLRDKTITSDVVFYNNNNLELKLHYIKYLFRASPR